MAAKEGRAPRIAKTPIKSNPAGKLKGGAPKKAASFGKPYMGHDSRPVARKDGTKQKAPYSITTPKN